MSLSDSDSELPDGNHYSELSDDDSDSELSNGNPERKENEKLAKDTLRASRSIGAEPDDGRCLDF
jgi:hypothetical protein